MKITLSSANINDCKLLFDWANDPDVRQNALNTDQIDWELHKKWFRSKLRSPDDCQIFIGKDQDQNSLGQIRFDRKNEQTQIAFSVDKEFRNKGIGTELIKEGMIRISEIWSNVRQIEGRVKQYNIPSQKSFLKAGFKLYEKGEIFEFIKEINH